MANLNSESYHSLIGFLTPEYHGFLKLQVIPRFAGTGTCISPVPVNRNRGILTSLTFQWSCSDHWNVDLRRTYAQNGLYITFNIWECKNKHYCNLYFFILLLHGLQISYNSSRYTCTILYTAGFNTFVLTIVYQDMMVR
jgi:hypothetical protein